MGGEEENPGFPRAQFPLPCPALSGDDVCGRSGEGNPNRSVVVVQQEEHLALGTHPDLRLHPSGVARRGRIPSWGSSQSINRP